MRHCLVALLLASSALALRPAPSAACSPPPEGWFLSGVLPADGDPLPADGPIILQGESLFPIDFDQIIEHVELTLLDADGAPVPGALERSAVGSDLVWWPDAPLEPGQIYDLAVASVGDPWVVDIHPFERIVEAAAPRAPSAGAALSSATAQVFEEAIRGECREIIDSCGGCEHEVLGHEMQWKVEVTFEAPRGPYARAHTARVALGVDADEAYAVLARTPPHAFGDGGPTSRTVRAGALDAWPSTTACAAVQVLDHTGAEILRDARCFDAPDPSRYDIATEAPPSEPADGGCDASGGGSVPWWALMLLLGLGRRRRALAAGAALCLFGLAGCDDPADDGSLPPSCLDCPAPEGLPPLAYGEEIPPPIFGGALAATPTRAVVGDPDRDTIHVVDLDRRQVVASHTGGQPGRVALTEDRAYVTLRADGQLLVLDLDDGAERGRHPVCAAPRGVAVHGERIHVACAGGQLVTLDAEGAVQRRLPLAPDLRDVVVAGDRVHVSRFRRPELITLDRDGAVVARRAPPTRDALRHADPSAPTVAWRTVGLPSGDVVMLHQRARLSTVRTTTEGGYGGGGFSGCGESIVAAELTRFPPLDAADPAPRSMGLAGRATLAVDVAITDDGVALAAAGNAGVSHRWTHGVVELDPTDPATWADCLNPTRPLVRDDAAQVTAVAVRGGDVIAFRRDVPELLDARGDVIVSLSGDAIHDAGHRLFHTDAGRGIACASCHPEGSEDGHAWLFEGHGLRRTQELRGGIAGSAPFHWTGDLSDMQHLMDEVMTRRMGGPAIPEGYTRVLVRWIDAQPVEVVDPIADGDVIAGEVLFADPTVGCTACHGGPRLTDDAVYDVGTGGAFVTPTLLGIGRRGSLMHDGCGVALTDRFDPTCGGGDAHGRTSHLSASEIRDLTAYLSTL